MSFFNHHDVGNDDESTKEMTLKFIMATILELDNFLIQSVDYPVEEYKKTMKDLLTSLKIFKLLLEKRGTKNANFEDEEDIEAGSDDTSCSENWDIVEERKSQVTDVGEEVKLDETEDKSVEGLNDQGNVQIDKDLININDKTAENEIKETPEDMLKADEILDIDKHHEGSNPPEILASEMNISESSQKLDFEDIGSNITVEVKLPKIKPSKLKPSKPRDSQDPSIIDDEKSCSASCSAHLYIPSVFIRQSVNDIIAKIQSSSSVTKLAGFIEARKEILGKNPPIDDFIDKGFLQDLLIEGLKSTNQNLQAEAIKALNEILDDSTEQADEIIQAEAIPFILNLLGSSDREHKDLALGLLLRIIVEGPSYRDHCISHGLIPSLSKLLDVEEDETIITLITKIIKTLCKFTTPIIPLEIVQTMLPDLENLLNHKNPQIVADILWSLSFLVKGDEDYIQMIVDSEIMTVVIPLLISTEEEIQTASLNIVGTIVTSTIDHAQHLLDCGLLEYIKLLLSSSDSKIVKDALGILSNISNGTSSQAEAIIEADLIPSIKEFLNHEDFNLQNEALWVLNNISSLVNSSSISRLIDSDIIPSLFDLLNCDTPSLIVNSLTILNNIITKMDDDDRIRFTDEIESHEVLEKIEALQRHEDDQVYQEAYKFLVDFRHPNYSLKREMFYKSRC